MVKGKVALVTGSTSGIGRTIARALAAEGASLVINGFGDYDAIDAWRSDWQAAYGVDIAYSQADVSKPAEVENMIAAAGEIRFSRYFD
jgi:3-hydroxybutyrate dehydrogenase